MPQPPIDPNAGAKLAMRGRIVTMDEHYTTLDPGVLYVDAGSITAAQDAAAPPPAGFDNVAVVDVQGTVFPGLIELHNHLAYDALSLWDVPEKYANRGQWGGVSDYRRLISGPMKVLGPDPELMPAVVRYVECKALVAGTTTSQGIELYSNQDSEHYYRGSIRNVEKTDDPQLPAATPKIGDVDATDAQKFLRRIKSKPCFLLHLAEGIDQTARNHFLALNLGGDDWALADSFAGIHCAGLVAEDFAVLARYGASMVWSPLSNMLLYGDTAKIKAAKQEGVKIGLGADWSPSGSKNLLGELKAARLAADAAGAGISDQELVAMATRTAAQILKWHKALGTLEQTKRADLLVLHGEDGDPYQQLLRADERDLTLVMVGGVPRYGTRSLVTRLGGEGLEAVRVAGRQRVLNLREETADPIVGTIPFSDAKQRLTDALKNLRQLAKRAENQPQRLALRGAKDATGEERWGLALDELEPTGYQIRPRLPLAGRFSLTGPSPAATAEAEAAAPKLSEILGPLKLDPLTVAGSDWLAKIDAERNLPAWVAPGLHDLYGTS